MYALTDSVTADNNASDTLQRSYHQIDNITVDLAYSNNSLARREQEDLADWLRSELLPALDELFSFAVPGEQIIRFEYLEFDFGNLPVSDYRQIIREQLIQKFIRLINEKRLPLTTHSENSLLVNQATDTTVALKHLLHYLRSGQLSAQFTSSTNYSLATGKKLHQQLFDSIVDVQQIATQLRALPNRTDWVTRLLKQFSERHRVMLLRQLAPEQVALALALLDLLQLVKQTNFSEINNETKKSINISESQYNNTHNDSADETKTITDALKSSADILMSAQPGQAINLDEEFKHLSNATSVSRQNYWQAGDIWHDVIEVALETPRLLNAEWLKALIKKTAARVQTSELQLFEALLAFELPPLTEENPALLKSWLQLKSIAHELLQASNINAAADQQHNATHTSQLSIQQRLATILIAGDAVALEQQWPQLLLHHKPLLIAGLKHYLVKAELRQQLLLKLPVNVIQQLLVLLAPASEKLLTAFIKQQVQFNSLAQRLKNSDFMAVNLQPHQLQSDNSSTSAEWLRNIYEIIANLLFNRFQTDKDGTIIFISPEKIFSEVTNNFANQQSLSTTDLYALWEPVFSRTINSSQPNITETASKGIQTTVENNVPFSALAEPNFSVHQQSTLLRQLAPAHAELSLTLLNLLQLIEQADISNRGSNTPAKSINISNAKHSEENNALASEIEITNDALKSNTEKNNADLLVTDHHNEPVHLQEALDLVADKQEIFHQHYWQANTIWHDLLEIALETPELLNADWLITLIKKTSAKTKANERQLLQALLRLELPQSAAENMTLHNNWLQLKTIARELLKTDNIDFVTNNQPINNNQQNNIVSKTTDDKTESAHQNPLTLQQRLAAILIAGDAVSLEQQWPQLLLHHKLLLIAGIKHYLVKAELRQQLLLKLPVDFIQQLLILLAPASEKLLAIFSHQQGKFSYLAEMLKDNNHTTANFSPSRPQPDSYPANTEWLRSIYEIFANLIFSKASLSNDESILLPSTKDLFREIVNAFSNQQNLSTTDLYRLWEPLFNNTINSSQPENAEPSTAKSIQATPESDAQSSLITDQLFSAHHQSMLLQQLAPEQAQLSLALLNLLQLVEQADVSSKKINAYEKNININNLEHSEVSHDLASETEIAIDALEDTANKNNSNALITDPHSQSVHPHEESDTDKQEIFHQHYWQADTIWHDLLEIALETPELLNADWLTTLIKKTSAKTKTNKRQLLQALLRLELPQSAVTNLSLQNSWLQLKTIARELLNSSNADFATDNQFTGSQSIENNHKNYIFNESIDDKTESTHQNPLTLQQRLAAILIAGDAVGLEQQWPQLLSHHKPLLIAGLKHYLVKAELRQQLLLKLPVSFIQQLLILLAPASDKLLTIFSHQQGKFSYLAEMLKDNNNIAANFSPSRSQPGSYPANTEWLRSIYEIFANLIFSKVSVSNDEAISLPSTKNMLREIADIFSNQQNLSPIDLYKLWEPVLNENTNTLHINSTQAISNISTSTENNSQSPTTEQIIRKQLTLLFFTTDINQWNNLWTDLIRQHRDLAIITVKQYWSKADVRQRLVQILPLPIIQDLLLLIAPDLKPLVHLLVKNHAALISEARSLTYEPVSGGLNTLAAEQWQRTLFNFISDLILPKANSNIDATAISIPSSAQLVRQLAGNYARKEDLPVEALQFMWLSIFESSSPEKHSSYPNPTQSETTVSLTNTTQSATSINSAIDFSSWKNKTTHELFDWCLTLKQSSHQRMELPKEAPLLKRLIDSFITLSPAFSTDFRDVFLSSIDSYATQATQTNEFLSQLLFNLIDGHLIDFEKLVLDSNPSAKTRLLEANTTPEDQQEKPYQTQHEDQIERRLGQLVQDLLAQHLNPFGLQMSLNYWQRVLAQYFYQQQHAAATNYQELLTAIREQATTAVDANYFYQQVMHALIYQQPLDLEHFSTGSTSESHTNRSPKPVQDNITHTAINKSLQSISTQTQETAAQNKISKDKETTVTNNNILIEATTADIITAEITAITIDENILTTRAVAENNNEYLKNSHDQEDAIAIDGTTAHEVSKSEHVAQQPQLQLEQLLLSNDTLNTQQLQQLQQHVNLLLQHYTQHRAQEWLSLLRNVHAIHQLIKLLPAHLLHQMASRLQPAPFAVLEPLVKLATDALALLGSKIEPLIIKQAKWEFIFIRLFATTTPLDSAELLKRCCEYLAQAAALDDSQRLLQLAERRLALLKPVAATRASMSLDDGNKNDEPVLNFDTGIHLNNVGQVLAAPFLPRLFTMLNLTADGKFIHMDAADRAVHLLQFMVTGQSQTPEYELTLNKILCGISTSMPISEGINITEQEQSIIEQMLQSMIQHWRAIGSTSVAGLRETFLQRQGWLVLDDEYWRLKVQEHTFDMLLDRLPWSISLIKHSWMDKPLRVSWRDQS